MTKMYQNILYTFISVILLFICIKAFGSDFQNEPKGIFLPGHNFAKLQKIDQSEVITTKLGREDNLNNSVGVINVVGHIKSPVQTKEMLCAEDLKVAVAIAADNGIFKLKYICSSIDKNNNVQLRAFGFRG